MKIEILSVGDELLSGTIVDTNMAWLGEQLWSLGHEVHWHTSVGDDPVTLSQALKNSVGRSDLLVVTGGLGPTIDDITLEVACKTFNLKSRLNEEALQQIKDRFQKKGRVMTPNNEKQALLPEGSVMIPNPVGTAPGCYFKIAQTTFFFFPGVPHEMKTQVTQSLLPWLETHDLKRPQYAQIVLRCFGKPEATIGHELEGIHLQDVDLAYRVLFPEILLKISARGQDKVFLTQAVQAVASEIRQRLGPVIYAEGDTTLPELVGTLLKERGESLAVAESCTGGHLANLLTDVPGSSQYFERGVVTYSNESKTDLLGVPASLIQTFGAVSSEVATAMAKGIRRKANTSYGIGITGIAGPTGATTDKPIGTVFIGFDSARGALSQEFHFPVHRDWFKRITAMSALDLLRRSLSGIA